MWKNGSGKIKPATGFPGPAPLLHEQPFIILILKCGSVLNLEQLIFAEKKNIIPLRAKLINL
jgi:hypothetical protein